MFPAVEIWNVVCWLMTHWKVVCWLMTHASSVHKSNQATIIRATTFRQVYRQSVYRQSVYRLSVYRLSVYRQSVYRLSFIGSRSIGSRSIGSRSNGSRSIGSRPIGSRAIGSQHFGAAIQQKFRKKELSNTGHIYHCIIVYFKKSQDKIGYFMVSYERASENLLFCTKTQFVPHRELDVP